jgi:flagellar hook-length control protein FliK
VVRQQLEALSGHQIAWQGPIWPGQMLDWEIEDPPRDPATPESTESQTWNTTLRLTLPQLGTVTARLQIDGSGVAVNLRAIEHPSAQALQSGLPELAQALELAGIPLRASLVENGPSKADVVGSGGTWQSPDRPPDAADPPLTETGLGPN